MKAARAQEVRHGTEHAAEDNENLQQGKREFIFCKVFDHLLVAAL
jgi:hypothetical protein